MSSEDVLEIMGLELEAPRDWSGAPSIPSFGFNGLLLLRASAIALY